VVQIKYGASLQALIEEGGEVGQADAEELRKLMDDGEEDCIDAFWRQKTHQPTKAEAEAEAEAGFDFSFVLSGFLWALLITIVGILWAPLRVIARLIRVVRPQCKSKKGKTITEIKEKYGKSNAELGQRLLEGGRATDEEDVAKKKERGATASKSEEKLLYDYQFVWFNAWLFNGTDNLWAALVLKLFEAAEDHYGREYKYAQRKAQLWMLAVAAVWAATVATAIALVVSMPDSLSANSTETDWQTDDASKTAGKAIGAIGGFASLIGFAAGVYRYLTNPNSVSAGLVSDVSNDNLADRLGFMDKVRQKLAEVAGLLEKPGDVPTVWDFFSPLKWAPDVVQEFIKKKFREEHFSRGRKPCRFIVFVDDLDRCEPAKCVEVLAAVNLMCEGLPFVIVLAIDPRVVVCSIESVNGSFYKDTGLSGFDYLDKIVQLPFAIAELTKPEKKAMLRGYLTGKAKGTRDYTLITELRDVLTVDMQSSMRVTCPGGVGFMDGMMAVTSQSTGSKLVDPRDGGEARALKLPSSEGGCHLYVSPADRKIYVCATYPSRVAVYDSNFEHLEDQDILPPPGYEYMSPTGVTCSNSYLFVADTSNNVIHKWDLKTRKYLTSIGGEEFGFNSPQGLTIVNDKYLFVADRGNDRVVKLNLDGSSMEIFGDIEHDQWQEGSAKRGFGEPNDVTADPDGNVLIYDTNNKRVVVCNEQGGFIHSILPGFFRDGGQGCTSYGRIACCHETGRVAMVDDDHHKIYIIRPYLY
jgi:DNA-binding beta-propeller fold protein YncE